MPRVSINNEMTTPKSFDDVTTPIENLAGFIINDLLQITIFAKYFSTLLQYGGIDSAMTGVFSV